MLNKELVQEWLNHPVTHLMRTVVNERIEEGVEEMLASNDPDFDRVIKGLVRGYRDVLEWEPEVIDAEVQGTESRTPSFD